MKHLQKQKAVGKDLSLNQQRQQVENNAFK